MSEKEFLSQIIEVAHIYHYRVAHFRPAQTSKGWRTPVSADGKGFPDLVLVSSSQKRILFIECKSDTGKLTIQQSNWRQCLLDSGAEYYLWQEGTYTAEHIAEILREGE